MVVMIRHQKSAPKEVVLQGVGVSPGVAIGSAFVVTGEDDQPVEREIAHEEVSLEIARFEDALIQTRSQIKHIQSELGKAIGQADANIFDVHLMVLEDRAFTDEIVKEITQKRMNAESIVKGVGHRYVNVLLKVEDTYLRERVADVRDVGRRILRNLSGRHGMPVADLRHKGIIVAMDLAPSETAMLRRDLVLGFATDMGSAISHTAIMARALKIPATVGLGDVSSRVTTGDEVLVDGNKGLLILRPTPERMQEYGKVIRARRSIESSLKSLRDQPAQTRDGRRVMLSANVEMVTELPAVRRYGAEGVGLFRSEYLYMMRQDLPSEDEQAAAYSAVAEPMAPSPVILRTADLGGDKFAAYLQLPNEANPFMGFRSIRFCLAQPEMFKTQLRAILRASVRGNMKLMYPMISSADEVIQANELLHQAMDELRERNVPFDEKIDVGAMIEIPSAAITADLIAPHVKFFSLGTNDLTQYTLAVDRVNDRVAHLYQPTHPGVLRLIENTVRVGHEHGLWVSVCGEMAGDPIMAPLLMGIGADELSMAPATIPVVKDAIRSVTYEQAQELAKLVLASRSATSALSYCRDLIQREAPEILEFVG